MLKGYAYLLCGAVTVTTWVKSPPTHCSDQLTDQPQWFAYTTRVRNVHPVRPDRRPWPPTSRGLAQPGLQHVEGHARFDLGRADDQRGLDAAHGPGRGQLLGRKTAESQQVRGHAFEDEVPSPFSMGHPRTPGASARGLLYQPLGHHLICGRGDNVPALLDEHDAIRSARIVP